MKTEKNILIAFILNIVFSIFELFGGLLILLSLNPEVCGLRSEIEYVISWLFTFDKVFDGVSFSISKFSWINSSSFWDSLLNGVKGFFKKEEL